jgi:hypothetical protein
MFYPDEEVARDIAALLTVLCRRLITVMGKSAEQFAEHEYPKPAKPEPNRRAKTKLVLGRAGNFG